MAPGRRHAKRARLADPQVALSGSDWRDWASLTAGPAGLIAERALANDVADYVHFRAVCTAWRACSDDPRAHSVFDRRFHPRRWIMLPCASKARSRRRGFLNTHTGKRIQVRAPDLRRFYILGPIAEGLILVCRKGTHTVHLLNPLTGQIADYPQVKRLLFVCKSPRTNDYKLRHQQQVQSGSLADDSTVAVFFAHNHRLVSVGKPGEKHWLHVWTKAGRVFLVLPFAGRLYCVTDQNILLVDTTAAGQDPRLVAVAELKFEGEFSYYDGYIYPVYDDEGGLILVERHANAESCFRDKFAAYRVELDTGVVDRVHDLGGKALFVCRGRSQCVAAGISPSIRPDTIYVCNKNKAPSSKDRPDFVAFDLSGARTVPTFGKRCIAYHLLRYVCSS